MILRVLFSLEHLIKTVFLNGSGAIIFHLGTVVSSDILLKGVDLSRSSVSRFILQLL